MTHAFFKALLFLGAGSVIHALSGEQDMRNMGGLRKKIPYTFATLMCAGVAIAGVPPFSGFHSKDAILLAAHAHHPWMFWVGVVTAGMTAFYVFRALFMTFFGDYRGHEHPHESPFVMTGPLMALAVLSLVGGYIDIPHWLEPLFPAAHGAHDMTLVAISVGAGVAGIALAYYFYVASPGTADRLAESMGGLYKLVYNKYFVDEAYDAAIVHPIERGSRNFLWKSVDVGFIDAAVNGVGSASRGIGGVLRLMQSGNIRSYATWIVFGTIVIILSVVSAGYMSAAGGQR